MARDEDYARRALTPFIDHFYAATVAGVRDSRVMYADTGHIHRKTTRRSLARDHIVHELRGRVDGHERMRVIDRNQTTYFVVDGELEVLIKKATEDGEVVLNDNQASLDFQANRQAELFDYDKTNLYLSYVDNDADPQNPSVFLICPSEAGHHWMMELAPPAAEISGHIAGAPTPEDGEALVRLPAIEKTEESE